MAPGECAADGEIEERQMCRDPMAGSVQSCLWLLPGFGVDCLRCQMHLVAVRYVTTGDIGTETGPPFFKEESNTISTLRK